MLQIIYGDHNEEKHIPDKIEWVIFIFIKFNILVLMMNYYSMKQVLPDGYSDYSSQEILDLHSDLKGKTDLEAKYQYVKLARSLPTFGVHFFVVRVRLCILTMLE